MGWIDGELEALEAGGLRRWLAVRSGPQTVGQVVVDGRTLINFSSNDYLGLAAGCLNRAVIEAVERVGWGSGASPLVTGRGELHQRLEAELAAFEGTEAALLFPSGFAANVGAITALVGQPDAIFSDAKNHASIIDGCRLSGARVMVYPHGDVSALGQQLEQSVGFRRRLIVTDGLFSMDGDLAPLVELAELAQRHGAMLLVDEAHASGVFGRQGRGVCEHLGVEHRVHVRVGTLSKALGSVGGFVAGCRSLIQWLANRARPYVFSTAPPEALAAAGLEALRRVCSEPERRVELLGRAAVVRRQLIDQGWELGPTQSQILPVILGDSQRTMQAAAALRDQGLLVPGIRPPSVPAGQALLRISLSYAHTRAMLEQLVAALGKLRRALPIKGA